MNLRYFRKNLILNLIVVIFFSIVMFALVVSAIQAIQWSKTPFIGGFLDPAFNFIPVTKIFPYDYWSLQERNLGLETRLLSIDGNQIKSDDDFFGYLQTKKSGEKVNISVISEGNIQEIEVELSGFTIIDTVIYFYLPLFASLICLVIGFWAFSNSPQNPLTVVTSIFFASLALILCTYFNLVTSHDLSKLLFLGVGMAAGTLLQIAILLPRRWKFLQPKVGLSFIAYPHNLILVAIGNLQLRNINQSMPYINTLIYISISLTVSLLVLVISFFTVRTKSISPLIRRYSETFLSVSMISFLPLFTQITVNVINHRPPPINPIFMLPMAVLPLSYFLISKRFTFPQTQKRLYRSLVFVFLTFFFGFLYFIFIFILNQVFLVQIRADNPLLIGSMIFLVLLVFEPIRKRINTVLNLDIDDSFINHEVLALEFTTRLSAADNQQKAIILLRDAIDEINYPDKLRIFVLNQHAGGYIETELTNTDEQNIDIIPEDAPLPATLNGLGGALFIRSNDKPVPFLENTLSKDDLDRERVYIPIHGQNGLLGWTEIISHPKQHSFSETDITLIEALTSQFALIYERSENLVLVQRRLKEMEVLNQIATAINNLSDFDQLLLTIFKILKEVIPANRFSLVLKNDRLNIYQRFFLFDNNRINISTKNPENLSSDFPEKTAITEKSAVIDNDENENWLFIPLKIEDGIIGALSFVNTMTKNIFSQSNLNLAQALANLVTGAIIKSRLLQASQSQMEHLNKLNEVSQQLTSTLAMEPLLKRIVESAMEILQATSGALLVVEEDESLKFKVTEGPIGTQLLGKRLPKYKGVAGESYSKRSPVIRNSISTDELYFWAESKKGYQEITNILAVPLMTQNEIIGILEVINKDNDLPFTDADINALEGFASQAAIAFTNARLYAKTDQALEKRVEELYTMQQIDRDLHASRKLGEALQTTLNAGLAYTKVDSGTIMLVDTYYHEIDDIWQKTPKDDHTLSKNQFELSRFPWFSNEIDEPYQIIEEDADALSEQLGLEQKYQAHIMITSKLEDDLFSLLILHLDSANDISSNDIDFLLTLNNHALIALRNSILYEDLQNAISAKNEFISFISHELKNPLTAIKGHADILAKGMVGQINDEQEDFLKTISHNVRRMSTFITDLSDQSQIESKSLRFVFATADVSDLVIEVLQTYNQQIKAKSIGVETRLDEDLPQVWCDRLRLIQILANLVSNAVKYTPEGGKIIIAAEYAINEWDPKGAAEVVHFSVADNGFGIDYEDQEQLFTKFFRGTNEKILKISGTGLGLRISKSLTEMMGGSMWFESTPGEGSTFHFTIPI